MKFHEVDRLASHLVLPGLKCVVAHGCVNTAETLAYIAVADDRRLYLQEGYSCMHKYLEGELNMSEDSAYKRIQAAGAARKFPVLFEAVESGRLHLSAVVMLAPHLTRETADGLIAAATHKTKVQIETVLAERFPRPDVPTLVMEIAPAGLASHGGDVPVCRIASQLAPGQVNVSDVQRDAPRAKVTPLAPQRFALQVTIGQGTHEKLRRAKELLAHTVRSGDVAEVLDRALDALIEQLERRRCGATDSPRAPRCAAKGRHIPAAVKREVARRDGDQCTFVSASGHRCEERGYMEFDHVIPVARGGRSTVANLRLRCHAHNQHAADRVFGKGFMDEKRERAKREAAEAKARKAAAVAAKARERAAEDAEMAAASDILPGLKLLGNRREDLRYAAHLVAAIPNASREERMHCAIKGLGRASMSRLTDGPRSPN
jgi:5-methylcytosine-specific restriction endonuclease McrA